MNEVVPALDADCQVWWGPCDAAAAYDESILDDVERARLARFVNERDRLRYAAAHTLARRVLAAHLGIAPGDVPIRLRCKRCGGAHGKPFVDGGPEYSLTHGGDLVAVGVTYSGPVGVDVEPLSRAHHHGLAQRVLAPEELALHERLSEDERPLDLLRSWTRKEAVLKATGDGLTVGPATVVVTADTTGTTQLANLTVPDGYLGAVAVVAAALPAVRQIDATALLRAR